ncbi:MAG TPA: P1 family peptidase [Candidatus Baltobacteraceae bacterium]|nr:P1 family peptidase [Candidatus Baltobacteraceae bacterium]
MLCASIAAGSIIVALACGGRAVAVLPFHFGFFPSGPLDAITDVAGVRVANLTLIRGQDIRTGATAVLPNADPWDRKVAAAFLSFNGNGEMTGTHWIEAAGYLEEPIVLTDTLDIGRADDGVVDWVIEHHPQVGITDDVPLPVVAECDDQLLTDIQRRPVGPGDVRALLDAAVPGQFARGSVGAGTGMRAFGFKAGIGSASRVLPASLGGYRVGVLVNDNTGSLRDALTIVGVPVGERLKSEYRTVYPKRVSAASLHGRAASGSIIIVVATDAPLDSREIRALLLRAGLGMGRTGLTSDVGSGDLFVGFSTTEVFQRTGNFEVSAPVKRIVEDDDVLNALYSATAEATQAAIYDALFEAKTMTGRGGATVYGLPVERVLRMLRSAGAIGQ